MFKTLVAIISVFSCAYVFPAETPKRGQSPEPLESGRFFWRLSAPFLSPEENRQDRCFSVKDPSVVFYDGRWHLFHTTRSAIRSHRIEYVSFRRWEEANAATRHVLKCRGDYLAAPQVFYFRPQKKWYLIYQVIEKGRKPALQPAYSTTENIENPDSWSPATLLFPEQPDGVSMWIDFWIISDDAKAHLFFTSLDGRLWRSSTDMKKFPGGFGQCEVVLREDQPEWQLFEASHIYKLKGSNKYLAVVEGVRKVQPSGRRFYVAYAVDRLDGAWVPLTASIERPFASADNVSQGEQPWTDNISHGELVREGYDETMTVSPANLRFVIQGVLAKDANGKKYGEIPWRLGLLELIRPAGKAELQPAQDDFRTR